MRDGLLLLYCAAIGFVAAGIAASFFKMVTSEAPRFVLLGESWFGMMTTFIFCALTGPAIIMDFAIRRWREQRNAVGWILASFGIATLWSTCSGIVVVQLMLSVGGGLT